MSNFLSYSIQWCNAKSQATEGCGLLMPSQRKPDLKIFERQKPITPKRPLTNPKPSGQPHKTSRLGDHQNSCSAAPKIRSLIRHSGETVNYFILKESSGERAQLSIDSHSPTYRKNELISRMERIIRLHIKTKYRSSSSSSAAFQWKPEGCHDGKIAVF